MTAGLSMLALLAPIAGPAAAAPHSHPHRHHRRVHAVRHRRHHARSARAGACPGAGLTAAAGNLSAVRAAVLCLVNAQRTTRGLPALGEDARLDRSAQGWSATMVGTGLFTHGSDFASRISAVGYDWSAAAENIATGFPTPAAVVAAWMSSTGHCRNILSPAYSAIGIGIVAAPVRGFASGAATWTEDFALPMGRSAPSGRQGPANGCPY